MGSEHNHLNFVLLGDDSDNCQSHWLMIGTPLHAKVFKFQFCILLRPPSFFCPNSPTGPTFWHVSNRTPFTSTSLLSEPAKEIFFKKTLEYGFKKKANQNHDYLHNGKRLRHKIELDNTIAFPFIKISFNTFFSVFLKSLGQLFIQRIQSYCAKKGQMCGNL